MVKGEIKDFTDCKVSVACFIIIMIVLCDCESMNLVGWHTVF